MLDLNHHFPKTSLAEAGIDPIGVRDFLDACAGLGCDIHSFLLIRNGKAAAEGYFSPYLPKDKQHVFSISKSWTATAIGLAAAEGRLSVRDKVISFFPDKLPETVSENLAAMEVRDLLRMGTGHETDTLPALRKNTETDWVETFLNCPVQRRPGSLFVYNSGASYVLSAILQKVTGESVLSYLTPRLFEPLGISNVIWDRSPQGICCGGWGIHVGVEDMAKLGVLYLNGGTFDGKRILPEEWVREATSIQIDNASVGGTPDWQQGYGYQIWRCQNGCFRFDGAYGQYMVAFPAQNAVLALTSFVGNMQSVMDAIWKHLLPAFHDAPLPPSHEEDALQKRLQTLCCPLPEGTGKTFSASYRCAPNTFGLKSITVSSEPSGGILIFATEKNEIFRLPFQTGTYQRTDLTGFPIYPDMIGSRRLENSSPTQPVGAAGNWTDSQLNIRTVYCATHHHIVFHLETGCKPAFSFAYPCQNFDGDDQATFIPLTPAE